MRFAGSLPLQIRGGLDEEKIVAVFAEQQPAVELAERLLRAAEEPRKPPASESTNRPGPSGSPRRSRSKGDDLQQVDQREGLDRAAQGMGTELGVEFCRGRLRHRDPADCVSRN